MNSILAVLGSIFSGDKAKAALAKAKAAVPHAITFALTFVATIGITYLSHKWAPAAALVEPIQHLADAAKFVLTGDIASIIGSLS